MAEAAIEWCEVGDDWLEATYAGHQARIMTNSRGTHWWIDDGEMHPHPSDDAPPLTVAQARAEVEQALLGEKSFELGGQLAEVVSAAATEGVAEPPSSGGPCVRRQAWTAEQYHASDATSRSDLVLFEESARLYHGQRIVRVIPPRKQTAEMRFGTLLHLRVLEPEEFRRRMWVKPANWNGKTKAAKTELAEVRARGLIECDMEDAQRIEACAAALLANLDARRVIEHSEREVTYTWTEHVRVLNEVVPIRCRARLDLLATRRGAALITDLKTTDDPSPREFARSVVAFGYHYQPPFYARPVRELLGVEPLFRFIAVRSRPPHEVVVFRVHPEDIAAADKLVKRSLERLAECVLKDTWSSPWERRGVQDLEIPRWALEVRS